MTNTRSLPLSPTRERVVAIIPARGGSRGIHGKNLRPIAGKPMLAHSVEHALATPQVDRVFVSTDDPAIAAVARQYGAAVIDRPSELAADECSSESALEHALDQIRTKFRWEPTLVAFLQATSPLRRAHDLREAIDKLNQEGADSLFSACDAHGFVWRAEPQGPRPLNYDPLRRPRRQDAPVDLVENGSIYLFRPWVLRSLGSRLGGKIAVYPMSIMDSFQIDEPEDLELLALLAQHRRPPQPSPELSRVRLLVLDFDGVMTDNRVIVDERGREAVSCNRGDGLGIALVKRAGVEVAVLSTERNPVVAARCRKLEVRCLQGCEDKLRSLRRLLATAGVTPHQVAYVGNDINDLACLQWVGNPIAVADAVPEVLAHARLVTSAAGGQGAVREVAEWLVKARQGARHAA